MERSTSHSIFINCVICQKVFLCGDLRGVILHSVILRSLLKATTMCCCNWSMGHNISPQQMAHRFKLYRSAKKLARTCMQEGEEESLNLFAKLTHVGGYRQVKRVRIGSLLLLGTTTRKHNENDEHIAVEYLLGELLGNTQAEYYKRCQFEGRLVHCEQYGRVGIKKRDDSVIKLKDGTFCTVKAVVLLKLDCLCAHDCAIELH